MADIIPTVTIKVTGLPGLKGDSGEIANAANFFQVANRFSELDTNEKKVAARQNLDLQIIDCGEFF
jgi:hypothetical protein